jgi:hypothetical protein
MRRSIFASVINADRKVATYKLALIRALCDIATMSCPRRQTVARGRGMPVRPAQ